jgi:Zn-dependent M16 (insulinase) family peptidase
MHMPASKPKKATYALEEVGEEAFSSSVLQDFLYGDERGERLEKELQLPELFAQLRMWNHSDWVETLER